MKTKEEIIKYLRELANDLKAYSEYGHQISIGEVIDYLEDHQVLQPLPKDIPAKIGRMICEYASDNNMSIDDMWQELIKHYGTPTKKELVSVDVLAKELNEVWRKTKSGEDFSVNQAQHIINTYSLNPPKREWWKTCEKFKMGATIFIRDGYGVDRFGNEFLLCDKNIYPVSFCTPYTEPSIHDRLKAKGVTDDEINELIKQHERQEFTINNDHPNTD